MKKILLVLSLMIGFSFTNVAFADGTYVQSANNMPAGNTGSTSVAKAYTSNVTAGNFLAAAVSWWNDNNPNGTRPTVTDSLGHTWTRAVEEDNTDANGGPSGYRSVGIWYYYNTSGGANTVTATFPISVTRSSISIVEATGVQITTDPLDKTSSSRQTNGGVGSTANSGSQTTTTPGQFIIGVNLNTYGGNPGVIAGAGFTLRETGSDPDGTTTWLYLETGTQTSSGSIAAIFTKVDGGGNDTTLLATFKSASGGGGGGGGTIKQRKNLDSPRTGTRTARQ